MQHLAQLAGEVPELVFVGGKTIPPMHPRNTHMSHDWNERLRGIEQVLCAQNERLETVKATLAELPKHLSIEVGSDWRDAFEDAVETSTMLRVSQRPLHGAIRG